MGYKADFPDFVMDVELPPGFEDASWKQEPCPCFRNPDLGLILFVDYSEELSALREHPATDRFSLSDCDADGYIGEPLGSSDSWDEILFFVEQRRSLRDRAHG